MCVRKATWHVTERHLSLLNEHVARPRGEFTSRQHHATGRALGLAQVLDFSLNLSFVTHGIEKSKNGVHLTPL